MTPALSLCGLGKNYGSRVAVGSVDLEIARGELFGLIGPNGAGKTTTIAMACGVIPPSRGSVAICGVDVGSNPRAAKKNLGYVPQEVALYGELSAVHNLRYFGALYRLRGATLNERIAWALDLVGLSDRATDRVKTFSSGMQRRLNLAAGLLHRPDLLVLDEPTAGVDPQSRFHLIGTLRRLHADGMAIVYSTHYLEEVEQLCQRVAVLDRGEIIATGTPGELSRRHSDRETSSTIRLEDAFLALTGHALRDAS